MQWRKTPPARAAHGRRCVAAVPTGRARGISDSNEPNERCCGHAYSTTCQVHVRGLQAALASHKGTSSTGHRAWMSQPLVPYPDGPGLPSSHPAPARKSTPSRPPPCTALHCSLVRLAGPITAAKSPFPQAHTEHQAGSWTVVGTTAWLHGHAQGAAGGRVTHAHTHTHVCARVHAC